MPSTPGRFPDDEATPGPSATFGKRAQAADMSETSDKSGRVPVFDGTGDYSVWRQHIFVESLYTDNEPMLCRDVLRALKGAPQALAVAGVTRPFTTISGIFDRLDPEYRAGAALSQQDAMRMLMRCRQRGRSLEEYMGEVSSLAAAAGTTTAVRVAALQAGLDARLAPASAVLPMDNYATFCQALKRVDSMTPKTQPKGAGSQNGKKTRGRQATTEDNSGITCYRCKKTGHKRADCPEKAAAKKTETTPDKDDSVVEVSGNE